MHQTVQLVESELFLSIKKLRKAVKLVTYEATSCPVMLLQIKIFFSRTQM